MVDLSKEHVFKIIPLCKGKDDIVLWSCIEGHLGKVWTDNNEDPQIAVVLAADFCYLLGNINDGGDMPYKAVGTTDIPAELEK